MGPKSQKEKAPAFSPYPTPTKDTDRFHFYKKRVATIPVQKVVEPEILTDPEEFMHRVNDELSFLNYEVHGTIVKLEFKILDSGKKLVSVYICGFVTHSVPEFEVLDLCEDWQLRLSGDNSIEAKRELFTCTIWGEVQETCDLKVGQPYAFKNMRKSRHYLGTANFDCLINNVQVIKA